MGGGPPNAITQYLEEANEEARGFLDNYGHLGMILNLVTTTEWAVLRSVGGQGHLEVRPPGWWSNTESTSGCK